MNANLFAGMLLWISVFSAYGSPVPAEHLFQDSHMSMFGFSPDSQNISLKTIDDKGKHLALFDIRTGELNYLIKFSKKQFLNDYDWVDDKTIVIKLNNDGKQEQYIVSLSIDEESQKLVSETTKIKANGYIVSSMPAHEGKVLFADRRNSGPGYKLYFTDLQNVIKDKLNIEQALTNIPSSISYFVYDEQSKRLIGTKYDSEEELMTLSYKTLSDKKWTPLATIEGRQYQFKPIGFLSENKLAVLSNKETDRVALMEYDVSTQQLGTVLFEHSNYDLTDANLSFSTGQVESVHYFDHGRYNTQYFKSDKQREAKMLANTFPDKQFYQVTQSKNNQYTVIYTFSSDDPGTFYLFDNETKHAEVFADKYPNLKGYKFAKTKTLKIPTEDGAIIEAYLTTPDVSEHKTLLVMPHGGPIGVRDYEYFNPTTQYFASRGFSILRVNFRGSSGFGKMFRETGVGQFGKIIEKDISAALDHVTQTRRFDKICAMGASYGGYSSFMLAITNPAKYDCVVAAFGIYDLPLLFNTSNLKVSDDYREFVARTVGEMNNNLAKYSPVYLADKVTVDSLIIAGKEDETAAFEHSNRMHYVLNRLNKSVEFVSYENTGHGHRTWWGEWHEHALVYDFLQRTLNLPAVARSTDNTIKDKLTEEKVRLADSFYFADGVDRDRQKALRFYRAAANEGHTRAMHNLANYYERGQEVARDFQLALDWYEKSSAAGYKDSSYHLGTLYFENKVIPADYSKSLKFFELAKKQEVNAKVQAMLARAKCTGLGTDKNVEECIQLLDFTELKKQKNNKNKITKESRTARNQAIVDIILEGQLSEAELQSLHAKIISEYDIEIFPMKVDEQGSGEFIRTSYREADYVDKEYINAIEGATFGSNVEVEPIEYFTKSRRRTALLGRWIRTLADGTKEVVHKVLLFGSRKNDWWIRYQLGDRQLDSAVWQLELFDLFGNKLYTKDFAIQNGS